MDGMSEGEEVVDKHSGDDSEENSDTEKQNSREILLERLHAKRAAFRGWSCFSKSTFKTRYLSKMQSLHITIECLIIIYIIGL